MTQTQQAQLSVTRPHCRLGSGARRLAVRNGFGLVEILVALAIVTLAFLPILSMCGQGNRSAKHSELSVQAALRASSLLDREAARPWQELLAAANGTDSAAPSEVETCPDFEEELTCELAPEGVIVLSVSVTFQLPGAGRQPSRTLSFQRVVGRPDLSVVFPARPDSV